MKFLILAGITLLEQTTPQQLAGERWKLNPNSKWKDNPNQQWKTKPYVPGTRKRFKSPKMNYHPATQFYYEADSFEPDSDYVCNGQSAVDFAHNQIKATGGDFENYLINYNHKNSRFVSFMTITCKSPIWLISSGNPFDAYSTEWWTREKAKSYNQFANNREAFGDWIRGNGGRTRFPAGSGGRFWCGLRRGQKEATWNLIGETPVCPVCPFDYTKHSCLITDESGICTEVTEKGYCSIYRMCMKVCTGRRGYSGRKRRECTKDCTSMSKEFPQNACRAHNKSGQMSIFYRDPNVVSESFTGQNAICMG